MSPELFLDVDFNPTMIDYGRADHDQGYGDEATNRHQSAHRGSIDRWKGGPDDPGMSLDQQIQLAQACDPDALSHFGYDELAALAQPAGEMVCQSR